ncbi:MAG: alpha/beta fold hydrolase [Sphingobium sp.]|nr:alpha/beta fold hydrolase [Sphingobium sp.]MBP6112271.1 alpha/beta fold hydrolase [Sphingobium sp.]MBP8670676.1 alpha/beta fold hydrolase [Sphingobium sp.]MBP9156856.1 alpha/beta fold hydrolase [Sphingobium sp.]MCC6481828.1 alpha/beta fold hydrolase [Sphingomonadaceae bacterium]
MSRSPARTTILPGFDGAALAVHEVGDEDARPVLLLHGLFSSAEVNWIKYGHAACLAEAGFRVIMPDLRAHGQSAAPHDAQAYPHNVLVRDARALIAALGLEDFDLGGFSLGARTCAALLAEGLRPRRAILAGMGLEGLSGWEGRRQFFLDAIDHRDTVQRDDPHFMAVMFMKTMKIDAPAARLLLCAGVDVDLGALVAADMPIGLICGEEDQDNGSAPALARQLAQGRYNAVPGTHMSCIARPELGQAIRDYLLL